MIKKKDFVEIDFTGRIKESGQIFDTTKENSENKEAKPVKVCVGDGMLVKGFDEALEGKEEGKSYSIEIKPENAFGPRKPELVKIIPLSVFLEKEINPYPGLMLNMDGILARISSVSGGRVTTDFNSPLAGKIIVYDFKIKRTVERAEEKLKALAEFYLGEPGEVNLEGNKAVLTVGKTRNAKILAQKAKELLALDVEIKESEKAKKPKEMTS